MTDVKERFKKWALKDARISELGRRFVEAEEAYIAGFNEAVEDYLLDDLEEIDLPEVTEEIITFDEEITKLINKYSIGNVSDTPDFILATFLGKALRSFKVSQYWLRHETN